MVGRTRRKKKAGVRKKKKVAPPYSLGEEGVTQGLLATWLECKQKGKLRYFERWTPVRPAHYLQYGELGHAVLAYLYHKTRGKKPPTRKHIITAVEDIGERHERRFGHRWGTKELDTFEKQLAQLQATLVPYFDFWSEQDYGGLKWMDIEGTFRYRFGQVFWLNGRFDGVFKKRDGVWLFEHKFKAKIDEHTILRTLERDYQTNFYLLALKKLTGKEPRGIYYNCIRRPGHEMLKTLKPTKSKPKGRPAEDIRGYRKRIEKEAETKPEHFFKRFEFALPRGHLDRFEWELEEQLGELKHWDENGRSTWTFGQPCFSRYGLCDFISICYDGDYRGFFQRPITFPELED